MEINCVLSTIYGQSEGLDKVPYYAKVADGGEAVGYMHGAGPGLVEQGRPLKGALPAADDQAVLAAQVGKVYMITRLDRSLLARGKRANATALSCL